MFMNRFRSSLRIQFLTVISGILVVALSLMGAMIIYNENSLLKRNRGGNQSSTAADGRCCKTDRCGINGGCASDGDG